VVILFLVPALLAATRERWRFYSGAIVLFILTELIVLSPWPVDNNKVLFIWFLFSIILVVEYLSALYERLKGLKGRGVVLAMVVFCGTFSGVLAIVHNFRTSYPVATRVDLDVADFVKTKTPRDAIFLTVPTHNHPASMLSGRKIVCGHLGILNSHGLPYSQRNEDITSMYTRPDLFPQLREKYHIDYVYIGPAERALDQSQLNFFADNYPCVFTAQDVSIYAVSARALQDSKNPMKISVTVPFYNEEGNVEFVLREIVQTLEGMGGEYEIIALDDGSQDGRPCFFGGQWLRSRI